MEYMTRYQKDLYKERTVLDKTSRTYNSSIFERQNTHCHNGINANSLAK